MGTNLGKHLPTHKPTSAHGCRGPTRPLVLRKLPCTITLVEILRASQALLNKTRGIIQKRGGVFCSTCLQYPHGDGWADTHTRARRVYWTLHSTWSAKLSIISASLAFNLELLSQKAGDWKKIGEEHNLGEFGQRLGKSSVFPGRRRRSDQLQAAQ